MFTKSKEKLLFLLNADFKITNYLKFRYCFILEIADPRCVTVTSDERLLVTDRENAKLFVIDLNNNQTSRVGGIMDSNGREIRFKQPYGVLVDGTDKVFVSDIEANSMFVL